MSFYLEHLFPVVHFSFFPDADESIVSSRCENIFEFRVSPRNLPARALVGLECDCALGRNLVLDDSANFHCSVGVASGKSGSVEVELRVILNGSEKRG